MNRQNDGVSEAYGDRPPPRRLVAWLGIAGAGLVVGIPTSSALGGNLPGMAVIVLVGSLAMLAGHYWGIYVASTGKLVLAGKLWPIALMPGAVSSAPSNWETVAAGAALLMLVPGVIAFAATLPQNVRFLLGLRPGRAHATGVALASVGALLWLAAPAIATATHDAGGERAGAADSDAPSKDELSPEEAAAPR